MRDIILIFNANGVGGAEKNLIKLIGKGKVLYNLKNVSNELKELAQERGIVVKDSSAASLRELHSRIKHSTDPIYYISNKASLGVLFYQLFFRIDAKRLYCGVRWNPNLRQNRDWLFYFFENLTSTSNYIYNSKAALKSGTRFLFLKPFATHSVIYNSIEKEADSSHPYITSNDVVFITAANLSLRKGYLQGIDLVTSINGIVRWDIYGKDYSKGKILERIQNHSKVHYKGFYTDWSLFLKEDNKIFFLPSKHGEGVPTVLIEAMVVNAFIIAYRVDGIPELLDDYTRALLLSPTESESTLILQIQKFIRVNIESRVRSNSAEILRKDCWNSFYQNHDNLFN